MKRRRRWRCSWRDGDTIERGGGGGGVDSVGGGGGATVGAGGVGGAVGGGGAVGRWRQVSRLSSDRCSGCKKEDEGKKLTGPANEIALSKNRPSVRLSISPSPPGHSPTSPQTGSCHINLKVAAFLGCIYRWGRGAREGVGEGGGVNASLTAEDGLVPRFTSRSRWPHMSAARRDLIGLPGSAGGFRPSRIGGEAPSQRHLGAG